MKVLIAILCVASAGCDESRQINPGAVVPVYEYVSLSNLHAAGETCSKPERLSFAGHVPTWINVHEFVHLAVSRLDAAGDHHGAQIVQQALRDLCGPTFEIGRADLLGPLP